MYKKTTDELEKKLLHTHPDKFSEYMDENFDDILLDDREFMKYMNEMFKKNKLKKQDVIVNADLPLGYGYKLLTQEKVTKQRDVILRICYAGELTIEETQQALRLYNMNTLYARDPRDALLMSCLNERPGGIMEVNQLLFKNKMQPLRTSGVQD